MSRIIRCPACAAVYPVEASQIQAAHGWLRCGNCQETFNGTGLDVPVALALLTHAPGALSLPAQEQVSAEPMVRVPLDDLLLREDRSPRPSPASPEISADLMAFSEALETFRPITPRLEPTEPLPVEVASAPSRAALYAVAVVLGLLLMGQVFFSQRHALAALWPNSLPVLASWCQSLGCQLKPWMDPKAILVEDVSFSQSGGSFVLHWSLRNTGPMAVATTSMELSLLDGLGKTVVRRVFLPNEVQAPALLSPGQAWAGSLTVQVDPSLAFSHYRLLGFYP